MKINLDKNINSIEKDLAIRGSAYIKIASILDTATIVFFYALVVGQLYYGEYGLALLTFGVMTLWKCSMALQDITQAIHVLVILRLIDIKGERF